MVSYLGDQYEINNWVTHNGRWFDLPAGAQDKYFLLYRRSLDVNGVVYEGTVLSIINNWRGNNERLPVQATEGIFYSLFYDDNQTVGDRFLFTDQDDKVLAYFALNEEINGYTMENDIFYPDSVLDFREYLSTIQ